MRRRIGRLIWTTWLPLLSCAGSQKAEPPSVPAAESRDAQAELRDLREQWALAGSAGRKQLRADLESFLERYPSDPTADEVRVLLARVALSERRYGAVRHLLEPILSGLGGTVRDEAQLVWASLDNAEGRHAEALERLAPLRGKLLSAEATDQWYVEQVRAAMAERRWRLAVETSADWLAQEGVASEELRAWVSEILIDVPVPALARLAEDDWSAPTATPQAARAREWLHRRMLEHLARVAIDRDDPQLARDLLSHAPPWLRASEHGDRLVVLSARAARDARVSGRILGVVIGGANQETARRSIDVAAGIAHVLGREGLDARVRLLPVEDRGSTRAALGTLTGLGAGLLIAGVDPEGASEALAFAAERSVPVVTLEAPKRPAASRFGFQMGSSGQAQREAAVARFPSVSSWQIFDEDEACREAGETRAAQQPEGILILAGASCLRRLPSRLWQEQGPLVVGLAAAHGPFPGDKAAHRLAAGRFPASLSVRNDETPAATGTVGARDFARSWYFALGHDVAQLARQALLELPTTMVDDPERVQERHEAVAEALRRARSSLWSTRATGFDDSGSLPRELRVEPFGGDTADASGGP